MSTRCSICRHPQAQEINVAITRGEPERTVAGQYDVTKSAVHRHKECLAEAAQEARKVRVVVTAATASDELARQRHRARKMEEAIDRWLTDPDDPESFSLAPRATEIPVVYIETGSDGKPKRKKSMLSKLLESVEQQLGVTVSYADTSGVVDARRLFIDLLRATNSQVELLARLTGEFQPERIDASLSLQGPLEAAVGHVMRDAGCDRDTAVAALSVYVPAARVLRPAGLLVEGKD